MWFQDEARVGQKGTHAYIWAPIGSRPPMVRDNRHESAYLGAVAPGRGFLHYSYCVSSPLPWRKHGLAPRREAWTPLNFPPASVWRYTPAP